MKISKFSKLALFIILPCFLLVNFASAQTPTTTSSANIVLDQALEARAQTSVDECKKFREAVVKVYPGRYKAVWQETSRTDPDGTVTTNTGFKNCVIVPATFADDGVIIKTDSTPTPSGAQAIQTLIQQQGKVNAADVAQAELRDKEEMNAASLPSKAIGWVLNFVLSALNVLLLWLAALAGNIFTTAVSWILDGVMPGFVLVGWTVIRDISNMFFILIMIVIGLAAILRIEKYDYKHLLPEVVMMALLVNFSYVIATTIISAVDTITAIFATRHGEIWAFVYGYVNFSDLATLPNGWMSGMVQGISKILFTFVALAAFLALTGLFIIRLVGLYVLIIFSPLAYVLDILPATKHYAHEWWEYFIKYLVWAPVAMFMVKLTILVTKSKEFTASESAFQYIIVMAFLWGAVIVAEHAGMVGGKAVVNAAEKFSHNIAHKVGHYAGRRYNEWSTHRYATPTEGSPLTGGQRVKFALVNPVAFFRGMSKRGEELAHHAEHVAAARGQEVADLAFTRGKVRMPHAQFVERAAENAKLKQLMDMKKEQLADMMVNLETVTGHEGETLRNAALKAMLANGYTDDVLRMRHFAEKYGEVRPVLDENDQPVKDENGNEMKKLVTYSPEVINRFLYGYGGGPSGHMTEQTLRILAEDAEKYGKDTGHPEIMGHAVYDAESKSFINTFENKESTVKNLQGQNMKELKNVGQIDLSVGEWKKGGGRTVINTAPHGFATQEAALKVTSDGKVQFTEDARMLSESISWGSMDPTPESEKFYSGVAQTVGGPAGMREVQHAQQRLRDKLLAEKCDELGRLVLSNRKDVRKIQRMIDHASDFTRALYAQKLDIPADNRKDINYIKYRFESDPPDEVRKLAFHGEEAKLNEDWDAAKIREKKK